MDANAELYAKDFYAWTQATAALIREGKWHEVDPKYLAEELESLGRRDRRELGSRLEVLMMHLLKLSGGLTGQGGAASPVAVARCFVAATALGHCGGRLRSGQLRPLQAGDMVGFSTHDKSCVSSQRYPPGSHGQPRKPRCPPRSV